MQEETRHHKQQLLLKPTRDKSQFAAVAEDVVSQLHTQQAQHLSCSTTTTLLVLLLQRRSIFDLQDFITNNKRDYTSGTCHTVSGVAKMGVGMPVGAREVPHVVLYTICFWVCCPPVQLPRCATPHAMLPPAPPSLPPP